MDEMRYCRTLYNVASAANSTLDPASVLQAIVQNTATAVGVKACSIMLLSPDRKELRHSAHYGLSGRYVGKGPLNADTSLAEALSGCAAYVLHAGSDPRVQYRAEAIQEGIASILSVPIWLRGNVIGVMRVYTAEPREFSPEDIEFAEAIANLGAIALDNARRYSAAESDVRSLEAYIYRYAGT